MAAPGVVLGGSEVVALIGDTEGLVAAARGTFFRRRWASNSNPQRVLAFADLDGPVAREEILQASQLVAKGKTDADLVAPARLLSVGKMRPTEVALKEAAHLPPGMVRVVPLSFAAGAQDWFLVDLDDLDVVPFGWKSSAAVAKISAAARALGSCTGRVSVVETSPTGVQVWLEVAATIDEPEMYWRSAAGQAVYARVGAVVLREVRAAGRTGGDVDTTAAAAGRYGRRPGWRLVDSYVPFRVQLLGSVVDPAGPVLSSAESRRHFRGVGLGRTEADREIA